MNWPRVEELLKDCQKGESAESVPAMVPSRHAELLKRYNGVEGFVSAKQYWIVWRAEQIEERNAAYSVAKYVPGVVLVGTDGGDTGFGVDAADYVTVPLIGMSPNETNFISASFDGFLERLASGGT